MKLWQFLIRHLRVMLSNKKLLVCILFLVIVNGCGRYDEPLPPESFAPEMVRELTVRADTNGVTFDWKSPHSDRRGKELETLDGYEIYRKPIGKQSDIVSTDIEETKIGAVIDSSVTSREEARKVARAEGKIGRRIKSDPSLEAFTFTDSTAEPGKEYVYTVVPINQGGVKGAPGVPIKVIFKGEASEIALLKGELLERFYESEDGSEEDLY